MELSIDADRLEATMLAGVRLVAFFVIAPPFSYRAFPGTVKVILGLGLAIGVAPRVAVGYESLDTGPFLLALLTQLVVGLSLGFLVFLVFAAVQSAGALIDLFGGFTLAQAFDPQSQVNGAQFTRLFQMTALALLFTSGGYQLIVGGLVRSFDAVPLTGTFAVDGLASMLVTAMSQMFLATLQIAGPLVVVLFLADVGLGLLTRVAPALNAFQMGFPIKIGLTVLFAGALFMALPSVVSSLTGDAVEAITGRG
ncbi:flagellar biosynthetic protein FliR [Curtobacterium flaccumfaciens]|jgi:flagellar biosynthetic protein FliR|uniref:Flagellar biosynthetic protein FliR n=1 Tax=Curtobacterium poinsettiae TaxID=159612 RepID=A0A9Q9P6H6_9MICO|nr:MULTISPECIES: flagellar biosynthetic protein FliR [Curtobacterium]MBB1196475.1 type III secretion protein [Curtobacterium flaccumfaciens]MBO9040308.1 flagellar biosynthetic protein FliR [Curtobacterium flaccumfaciens pv. flaccumfaciens]MBO9043694.1 flagellar biosynthetic protein FliR [Curtobacterium flaccumfaciens pv. flaccumfaciens]MBT1633835.1 flagellar biosynthetic protein FliR [Curtobacterium flaccumfaciens pv. oortii]MBT1683442.1 flagellar biosynthetic protein FliR [Curtobacterium flac